MPRSTVLVLALTAGCPKTDEGNTDVSTIETGDTGTPPPVITGTVGGFTIERDAAMPLMFHATWKETGGEDSWVEYRFEGDEWLVAPRIGTGAATILGIPPETDVEARAVEVFDGTPLYSDTLTVTSGSLPPALLVPQTSNYDPSQAYGAPYAMISVASGNFTFEGPYFIEIFDRAGRVVWFHRVPGNLFSLYPSVAFAGTHIWYDQENIFNFGSGDLGVTRRTLDGRAQVFRELPNLGQAIGEGPDSSFFYELRGNQAGVNQVDAGGNITQIWDCDAFMAGIGRSANECELNTTNWAPARNSVLASQFFTSTVFEIDLDTGEPVRQFGQLSEGDPWDFSPIDSLFAYQHFPNFTSRGTLLVSTHVPCGSTPNCNENSGQDGIQLSSEYELDDSTNTIRRIGFIRSDDLWATQAGETYELPNGNRVQGYGQDGAAREYTADGDVVWQVEWDKDFTGYRSVGHLALIEDLYALNVGVE